MVAKIYFAHLWRKLRELEDQAVVAHSMRRRGIRFNVAYRNARIAHFTWRADQCKRVFDRLIAAGRISKLSLGKGGTTGEVKKLLLSTLKLQTMETTDSGQPSTNAWSLQMWGVGRGGASRLAQFVCHMLLRYRRYTHMRDMIVSLEPSPDCRVHAPWNPWGALTGRWSCSKPNLMNLPKRGEPNLRPLLAADPGCCFVAADADKAELRAVAIDAGDAALLAAFAAGVDVHQQNAVDLFGPKADSACRDLGKRLIYGFNYGAKAETVHHALAPIHPRLRLEGAARARPPWRTKTPPSRGWAT